MDPERSQKIKDEALALYDECKNFSIGTIERNRAVLENKYSFLRQNSGTLFDKICAKELKLNEFRYVFKCLDDIHSGKKSQHDASVKVGTMLANNYIHPKLEGVPPNK